MSNDKQINDDVFSVGDFVSDMEPETAVAAVATPQKKQRMECDIIIMQTEDENAPQRVYVGAQGYQAWIERGVKVTVPEVAVNVLRDAVTTKYRKDPNDINNLIAYDAPSYPFTLIATRPASRKYY